MFSVKSWVYKYGGGAIITSLPLRPQLMAAEVVSYVR